MHKETLQSIEQVNEIIKENGYGPMTLRQAYYQGVNKAHFLNTPKSYVKLSRICVIGRELGLIPEEVFVDRMRPFYIKKQWNNPSNWLVTIQRSYRKNYWEDQPNYVELWIEKDALLGVVEPIADKYHIGLQGGRGYVSYTVLQKAAERFQKAQEMGKNCYLLYAGDFDPSGENIFEALDKKLHDRHKIDFVYTKRIALNEDQIKQYNLPSALPKTTDLRAKKFIAQYGNIAVELDALPPKIFRDLIDTELAGLIDLNLFKKSQEKEEEDRKKLRAMIHSLQVK